MPYHWQVHYHPVQNSIFLGRKLKSRESKDMECAAGRGISRLYLKSMAGVSVCVWESERRRENERERWCLGVALQTDCAGCNCEVQWWRDLGSGANELCGRLDCQLQLPALHFLDHNGNLSHLPCLPPPAPPPNIPSKWKQALAISLSVQEAS